jgi:hypothetical protein
MPNDDLLDATMDHILAHPDEHAQHEWVVRSACGTVACFAGRACLIAGLTVIWGATYQAEQGKGSAMVSWEGVPTGMRAAAVELLGISSLDAAFLFSARNTDADLKDYVDQLHQHGRIVRVHQHGDPV